MYSTLTDGERDILAEIEADAALAKYEAQLAADEEATNERLDAAEWWGESWRGDGIPAHWPANSEDCPW